MHLKYPRHAGPISPAARSPAGAGGTAWQRRV